MDWSFQLQFVECNDENDQVYVISDHCGLNMNRLHVLTKKDDNRKKYVVFVHCNV